jgi:hypothetical protein
LLALRDLISGAVIDTDYFAVVFVFERDIVERKELDRRHWG